MTYDGSRTHLRHTKSVSALALASATACILAAGALHALALGSASLLEAQEVIDLPAEDRPLSSAVFEEVYRVGGPDVLLSRVVAAEFGPSGALYLQEASGTSMRLLAVEDGGGSARQIGRRGGGPGEFTMLSHFAVLADGRIAAFDAQHNAYQIFGADNTFERMVRLGGGGGVMGAMTNIGRRARADRAEASLISMDAMSLDMSSLESGEVRSEGRGRTLERIGLDGDDAAIDTLLVAWSPPPGKDVEMNVSGISMSFGGGLRLFEPELRYDPLPDGMIAFSDSSAYAIKIANGDGQVGRVLHRPLAPRPVTNDMQQSAKESTRREMEESEQFAAMKAFIEPILEQQLAQMTFYHEVPVVSGMRAGWERAIWVERSGDEPWLDNSAGPIDVITYGGEYLGTFPQGEIDMPLALGPNGLAAFVELDEFDVPTVVVKRLPEELR